MSLVGLPSSFLSFDGSSNLHRPFWWLGVLLRVSGPKVGFVSCCGVPAVLTSPLCAWTSPLPSSGCWSKREPPKVASWQKALLLDLPEGQISFPKWLCLNLFWAICSFKPMVSVASANIEGTGVQFLTSWSREADQLLPSPRQRGVMSSLAVSGRTITFQLLIVPCKFRPAGGGWQEI